MFKINILNSSRYWIFSLIWQLMTLASPLAAASFLESFKLSKFISGGVCLNYLPLRR